ncbi:hypothetical protein DPMN_012808 [Dreissena polymorpha]|uniref:Uncharacterized protein n=1 Tax=Dreissena polymorpha TaxID=45954 RepID=A0A9D4N354_DREPO|nr:hypothetical protein DPMN_012808 [Dreissena polymorpha]
MSMNDEKAVKCKNELDKLTISNDRMRGDAEKQKASYEHDMEKQKQQKKNAIREINLKLSESRLEKEIMRAELKGESKIKEAKINCQGHTIEMYETELNSIPTRFES